MFSFSDVKMMFDWGCFTEEQVQMCIRDSAPTLQIQLIIQQSL